MIISFSIRKNRTEDIQKVTELKMVCIRKGLSFSDLVVKALSEYAEKNKILK